MNDNKDQDEPKPDWSEEFLAWGNSGEKEEVLDIDRSGSPWREVGEQISLIPKKR